jgi:hypothetical protein
MLTYQRRGRAGAGGALFRAPPGLLATDEPAAEEIEQAHHGWIRAAIRVASAPPDAATVAQIAGMHGGTVKAADLYLWRGAPTNTRLDTYFTHMSRRTLDRYARQAAEGRAVLVSHDWSSLPVGQSFAGEVVEDAEDGGADGAPEDRTRDRTPAGPPLGGAALSPRALADRVARAILDYYMIRGLDIGPKPNDALIRAIETGTIRDLSIGFNAGQLICDICENEIFSRNCPHIPGVKYAPDDSETGYAGGMPMMYNRAEEGAAAPGPESERPSELLSTATVEDGDLLETSFAFDGATPEAIIIPAKVRLVVATNGRLAKTEARDLAALEYRMGVRLAAPELYQAAARTTSTPSRRKDEPMSVKQGTGPAASRRAVRDTPPPDSGASGGASGDSSGLSDLILTQTEAQASAVADRMDSLDQRTAAVSAQVDATNEQIAALAGSEDPAANDLSAAANQLVSAYQAELEGLASDRAAAAAELDALNATISALGGTTVDPPPDPAADSTSGTGGASGGTSGGTSGTNARRGGTTRRPAADYHTIRAARPAARAGGRRDTTPGAATGDPTTDVAALADVIATQATDQAQAQADAIAALDEEITGLEAEIAASQAALDAFDADPNTDPAARQAEQDHYDSLSAQLDAKRKDRDAAAAELDAVNQTAQDTGGTTATPPPTAPDAGMGATAGGTLSRRLRDAPPATRVAASLLVMRRIVQGQIIPNRLTGNARAVDSGTVQQIIDQVNAVLSALQQVLTDLGQDPARTVNDRAIWSILARAATETGAAHVGIGSVRQLVTEAQAGRAYRAALIDLTVAARVSALGAERANADSYRARLLAAGLDTIEDDYESYTGKKADLFRAGRNVPGPAAAAETAGRQRPAAGRAPGGAPPAAPNYPPGEDNLFALAGAYRRDGGGGGTR